MHISRIQIRNFRNFHDLDVKTGKHLVIVGENRVGKSNFLHALRLILDPSLSERSRCLQITDFWDGAYPLTDESTIQISVDISDFEDDEKQLAVLSDYCVEHSPRVARLTYEYSPKPDLESTPSKDSDFDFQIYGGDDDTREVTREFRQRMPMDLLPALRDAESDLSSWRRSPLRPLLDALCGELDDSAKESLAYAIEQATKAIGETDEVKELGEQISKAIVSLIGPNHSDETSLQLVPSDVDRLIRTLKVFIDDGTRSINDASLGSANVIYLALKLLCLELEIEDNVRDHSFLAIEEPEAHLHPHIQRRIFRAFLNPRKHLVGSTSDTKERNPNRSLLLSTHSPHIASVSPLNSIVLLRATTRDDHRTTIASSTAEAGLEQKDVEDIERYLDVTRGELLFCKGVLLVEGDAEEYLVPTLCKQLGHDLDELGIAVCSVSGTNFMPYVKLLSSHGLDLPFAVITDEDPQEGKDCLALSRVKKIAEFLNPDYEYSDDVDVFFAEAESEGIFVTEHTLEIALFNCGRPKAITRTVEELTSVDAAKERAKSWRKETESLDAEQLLKDIGKIGKGRFAQRLSTRVLNGTCTSAPDSVKNAIAFLVEQI